MVTDKERLDALEAWITNQPLTLWFGEGAFPGGRALGVSLMKGSRTLRKALDDCVVCQVRRGDFKHGKAVGLEAAQSEADATDRAIAERREP